MLGWEGGSAILGIRSPKSRLCPFQVSSRISLSVLCARAGLSGERTSMKRIICSVVGLCFLAGSGIATAQSLADVAKKSKAQSKSAKRPARVYTNADVPVTAAATPGTAAPGFLGIQVFPAWCETLRCRGIR